MGLISEVLNENNLEVLKSAQSIYVNITDKDVIEDIENAGLISNFQRCFFNKADDGTVVILIDYDRKK